jgi:hypothetical protein
VFLEDFSVEKKLIATQNYKGLYCKLKIAT